MERTEMEFGKQISDQKENQSNPRGVTIKHHKPADNNTDEETIVQEIMVSSNGFVESVSDRMKHSENLKISFAVGHTVSDDIQEFKNATEMKKLKKGGPAHDSNRIDDTLTENIHSVNDNQLDPEDLKYGDSNLKRGRIEPPNCGTDGIPSRKSRTEKSNEPESEENKKGLTFPECTKTFPSPSSVSTHVLHHKLENSLKQDNQVSKYRCGSCLESFKNNALLTRHICANMRYKCNVCSQMFKELVSFSVHKRGHCKENLVKATTTKTIPPKRTLQQPSAMQGRTSRFRKLPLTSNVPRPLTGGSNKAVPKTSSRPSTSGLAKPLPQASCRPPTSGCNMSGSSFKCPECSKHCSSQSTLLIHRKTHKNFPCSNCKQVFGSKLLLDTHKRITCVKTYSPQNKSKRLSFEVRQPRETLWCDSCPKTFQSSRSLFTHKVKDHGVLTRDENVAQNQKKILHKPMTVHGGIRPSVRLAKALQEARRNLMLPSVPEEPEEETVMFSI